MTTDNPPIVIIYNGGTYGTFIEWCLNYFGSDEALEVPFNSNGNSHRFDGNSIDVDTWRQFKNTPKINSHKFVRLHPKTHQDENVVSNINEILLDANKIILLHPTFDSIIWNINNKFTKIWEKGWLYSNKDIFLDRLKAWQPDNNNTTFEEYQIWEIREFLSFNLYPQHLAETELVSLLEFDDPRVLKVPIESLTSNFSTAILKIFEFCQLPVLKYNFEEIYQQWLPLQFHKDKDYIVGCIIDSIKNDYYYNWENKNLTVADEAIVQMKLRTECGFELQCYNLNTFPTCTTDLKKLLIHNTK